MMLRRVLWPEHVGVECCSSVAVHWWLCGDALAVPWQLSGAVSWRALRFTKLIGKLSSALKKCFDVSKAEIWIKYGCFRDDTVF